MLYCFHIKPCFDIWQVQFQAHSLMMSGIKVENPTKFILIYEWLRSIWVWVTFNKLESYSNGRWGYYHVILTTRAACPDGVGDCVNIYLMDSTGWGLPDSGPGPESGVSWVFRVTWTRKQGCKMAANKPEIYSQNDNFCLVFVYDMIFQFLDIWGHLFFANNVIHTWSQVMQTFDWEMPQMYLEHRLSAPLQLLHLHSRLNTWF